MKYAMKSAVLVLLCSVAGGLQAASVSEYQALGIKERISYMDSLDEAAREDLHQQLRDYREALSDEERQAQREAHKAQWQALSEQERQAITQNRREKKQARLANMSPEERAAQREQRKIKLEETLAGMSESEQAAFKRGMRFGAQKSHKKGARRDRKHSEESVD